MTPKKPKKRKRARKIAARVREGVTDNAKLERAGKAKNAPRISMPPEMVRQTVIMPVSESPGVRLIEKLGEQSRRLKRFEFSRRGSGVEMKINAVREVSLIFDEHETALRVDGTTYDSGELNRMASEAMEDLRMGADDES